ncbi:MAG TPA: hypothetical protein VD906_03875 [Caulobacteraceae bacterium]|nr:hypothetical protein [Caulobacteraceae bacterium]
MGQSTDPQNVKRHGDELEDALKKAADAGRDDDPGQIAADDAGGTRLAENLDDEGEAQAHPS